MSKEQPIFKGHRNIEQGGMYMCVVDGKKVPQLKDARLLLQADCKQGDDWLMYPMPCSGSHRVMEEHKIGALLTNCLKIESRAYYGGEWEHLDVLREMNSCNGWRV